MFLKALRVVITYKEEESGLMMVEDVMEFDNPLTPKSRELSRPFARALADRIQDLDRSITERKIYLEPVRHDVPLEDGVDG